MTKYNKVIIIQKTKLVHKLNISHKYYVVKFIIFSLKDIILKLSGIVDVRSLFRTNYTFIITKAKNSNFFIFS